MSITFNSISSNDYGVVVQRRPNMIHAARSVDSVTIPGRNGDLLIDNNRFNNYTQTYEVYCKSTRGLIQEAVTSFSAWLLSPAGYRRLEDSYESDYYRMARFVGPVDAENLINTFGTCELQFDCQPQRWLKSGEETITVLTSAYRLSNPTDFDARPLIRVYGTGTLTVGSRIVEINACDTYVDLDCELQDAFKSGTNCNGDIEVGEFPILSPGTNNIQISGSITQLTITPRWWTI